MRQMWAILSASSGYVRSSRAMFVSGPDRDQRHRLGRGREGRAQELERALGAGADGGLRRSAPSRPLAPWTSGAVSSGRTSGWPAPAATGTSVRPSSARTRSALRVVLASGRVAADRRDAQHVELRPRERQGDRQGVVVPGSQSMMSGAGVGRAERPRSRGRHRGVGTAALSPPAGAHRLSPGRTAARGGRTAHPADDARDHDDRDDVRDAVEQLRRDVHAEDRQQRLGRVREAEHERRPERADRVPRAEDDRREGDEALARRSCPSGTCRRSTRLSVRAGDARQGAGHDHRAIADLDDVDADGAGRRRLLARRPEPEAPAGPEQHVGQEQHEHDSVKYRYGVPENRIGPEDRDLATGPGS